MLPEQNLIQTQFLGNSATVVRASFSVASLHIHAALIHEHDKSLVMFFPPNTVYIIKKLKN